MPFPLKRYRAAVAVLIVALLAVGWLALGHGKRTGESPPRTVKVETGDIEDVVTAQGKLEPKDYVDVGLQVSGQIKKLYADIGDDVKQGQLLAEIDPRIYEARLEADEAQLHVLEAQADEQQAALTLAQRQQKRNEAMIKTKAISKDAFDQGKAALDAAQARLASVKAQIDVINSTLKGDRTNLDYTKIYAPMDGTVATLPVREGETLNSVQSAPTVMQVADLDVMTVRAQVAEADVMRLRPGMEAYFTTLGDPDRRFTGTVRQIQPSPEVINDVVLYDVLIDAENKERRLMDGMSTEVFFVVGKVEGVPVLPLEALGKRVTGKDDASGKAYLVRVPGEKKPVLIHTGLADRTRIEVTSGLKPGDAVAIPERGKTAQGGQRNTSGGSRGGGMRAMGPRL